MGTPENNYHDEELRQRDPGDGYDDPEGVKHRTWKRDTILRVIPPNAVGRREGHQQEESNANDEESNSSNDEENNISYVVGQTIITSTYMLDNIEQNIIQDIESLSHMPKTPCIFKVHQGLRHVNPNAYTPILVSIGPYHHGHSKYMEMEQHKKRYLESLLKRTKQKISVHDYLQAIIKLEDAARDCYADPFALKGGPDSFIQMMLLDACFVVEFLRKWDLPELRDEDDPIFRTSWIKIQICRDLMLLENQLPFFVLLELFNMSSETSSPHPPFMKLAEIPIHQMLLKDDYFSPPSSQPCESSSIKHFLDFVHNVHVPATFPNYPNQTSIPNNDGTFVKGPCVMELEEAGVKFQAVEDGDKISVFEVKFEDGVLKIPKFEVSDSTEIFLRNIIAYEQLIGDDHKPKYFTDFTFFLDALINTKEDVNKLCGHQIIINIRGDDDEVARMFNKLGEGRILEPSSFYYSQVLQKLNEHCQKRWNKARAKLRHDYFNSPWATVSTIAATFLLTLTLTQTVASLIPLFR
ncbi:UPF0481 protein At3g47200-like [Actinidia eriantha]|uniref:UPF0481 protein At3g47200-like n=1 Tax=Actinidia eriantha TaxID=165200 RepID=UPI00258F48C6|nr:UPF0481 protein At3g47200-like [Actinidia eriantha]